MNERTQRKDDQLEYDLREFSERLRLIAKIAIIALLVIGLVTGVRGCSGYNDTIGSMYDTANSWLGYVGVELDEPGSGVGTFFMCVVIFAVLAGIVWVTLSVTCFILDCFVDIHYYSRVQAELSLMGDLSATVGEERSNVLKKMTGVAKAAVKNVMLPGDWKCSKCGRIHRSDEMECICGGKKPGQKSYVPDKDWVCAGCGRVHKSYVTSCTCGLKKGEKPAPISHTAPVVDLRETNTWKCSSCGSAQPNDAMFCSNCGKAKGEPAASSKPATEEQTWVCTACGAVHSTTDIFCSDCGQRNPEK